LKQHIANSISFYLIPLWTIESGGDNMHSMSIWLAIWAP